MNWPLMEAIEYMEESNPEAILAPKTVGVNSLLQMFYPGALECNVIIPDGTTEKIVPMEMADEMGYFATLIPGKIPPVYQYEVKLENETLRMKDAYAFSGYALSDKDIDKLNAGCTYEAEKYLGAHKATVNKAEGVKFGLWAPNAVSVSVIGTFNNFTAGVHQMILNEKAGIYELFIPDVDENDRYLYEIKVKGGESYRKLDPYATSLNEKKECCIGEKEYIFTDEKFIASRKNALELSYPMSVLEIDAGDERALNLLGNSEKLLSEISDKGYTHVELAHIFESSDWDNSGYGTLSYFAVNEKIGSSYDLKKLIDLLHNNNIGVIIDWSPAFFASDDLGMKEFDGTALYEHLDPRKGIHPIYGTRIFNYARPQVADFLISNAFYWLKEFHVDGLKIDNVSSMIYLDYARNDGEWIANIYGENENLEAIDFIKKLNKLIKKSYKDVMIIAQEESAYPGVTSKEDSGLGFDYKLNEGFMCDYMDYISYDPYFRAHHHNELTFSMVYQYSENFISAVENGELFDEFPGEEKDKLNNLKLSLGYIFAHPGKKLIKMNFDKNSVMLSSKVKDLVKDLNKMYKKYPALYECDYEESGFSWINCIDANKCMISFLRKSKKEDETLMVVCNFANIEQKFPVGTPLAGKYKEILNTDSKDYGGSNKVNSQTKVVSEIGADSLPYNIEVRMAPLSMAVFKYTPFSEKEKFQIQKRKEAALAKTRAEEFENIRNEALEDYDKAKKEMEDALARMKDAETRAEDALKKKEAEILKAKKALDAASK